MDLLLLGTGMGIVGGLIPSSMHLIALSQVALNRWMRAILILTAPLILVDGAFLIVTFLFYQYVPPSIAHYTAYVGGGVLVAFGGYSLWENRHKTQEEMARSANLTYAGVAAAILAEVGAPGTWIYWLTIAGPILAEGRLKGYWHIAPFFVGGAGGYYGASIFSVWLMAWGASLHKGLKHNLFLIANLLLLALGISYLLRAYFGRTRTMKNVKVISCNENLIGKIMKVKITKANIWNLEGNF